MGRRPCLRHACRVSSRRRRPGARRIRLGGTGAVDRRDVDREVPAQLQREVGRDVGMVSVHACVEDSDKHALAPLLPVTLGRRVDHPHVPLVPGQRLRRARLGVAVAGGASLLSVEHTPHGGHVDVDFRDESGFTRPIGQFLTAPTRAASRVAAAMNRGFRETTVATPIRAFSRTGDAHRPRGSPLERLPWRHPARRRRHTTGVGCGPNEVAAASAAMTSALAAAAATMTALRITDLPAWSGAGRPLRHGARVAAPIIPHWV